MELSPQVIWFALGFILLIAEFIVPGFVVMFFGIGAWVVCGVTFLFDISINYQLVLFIVSSVLLLVLIRKYVRSLFSGLKTGVKLPNGVMDEYVGGTGTVHSEISINKPGKIEYKGSLWNAESDSDLSVGSRVLIIERKGLSLIVKPLI